MLPLEDVMNHVNNLLLNAKTKPAGYWKNSSDNAIIRSFIDFSGESIIQKLEMLLSGGYRVRENELDKTLPVGNITLVILNAEIMEIFETTIEP